jgi:hypothetical protein
MTLKMMREDKIKQNEIKIKYFQLYVTASFALSFVFSNLRELCLVPPVVSAQKLSCILLEYNISSHKIIVILMSLTLARLLLNYDFYLSLHTMELKSLLCR